jgi:hypothetical protein
VSHARNFVDEVTAKVEKIKKAKQTPIIVDRLRGGNYALSTGKVLLGEVQMAESANPKIDPR